MGAWGQGARPPCPPCPIPCTPMPQGPWDRRGHPGPATLPSVRKLTSCLAHAPAPRWGDPRPATQPPTRTQALHLRAHHGGGRGSPTQEGGLQLPPPPPPPAGKRPFVWFTRPIVWSQHPGGGRAALTTPSLALPPAPRLDTRVFTRAHGCAQSPGRGLLWPWPTHHPRWGPSAASPWPSLSSLNCRDHGRVA